MCLINVLQCCLDNLKQWLFFHKWYIFNVLIFVSDAYLALFIGVSGPVNSAALEDPNSLTAVVPLWELCKEKRLLENSGRTHTALVKGSFLLTRKVPTCRMVNKRCLFWIDTSYARWIYISTSLTENVHSLCRESRILRGPRKRNPIHFHRTIHRLERDSIVYCLPSLNLPC